MLCRSIYRESFFISAAHPICSPPFRGDWSDFLDLQSTTAQLLARHPGRGPVVTARRNTFGQDFLLRININHFDIYILVDMVRYKVVFVISIKYKPK